MNQALVTSSLLALMALATTEVYPGADQVLMHTDPHVLRSGDKFEAFVNQTANITARFVDNAANATNYIVNELVNGTEHMLNKTISAMQSNETFANIDDLFIDLIEEIESQIEDAVDDYLPYDFCADE